jgi:Flp pilus assembly protein TadD
LSTPPSATRRNDPCPCGSGKRYKQCHGSLAAPGATRPLRDVLAAGIDAHQRGDRKAARREYEEALRLDAESAVALHYLGVLSWEEGAHDEALRLMTRSIAADSSVPDFHNNLGLLHRDRKDALAAESAFQAALRLDESYGEAHNGLGLLYKDLGRHAEAIEQFRRAAALMPQRPEIVNNRGLSQQLLGDARGAIEAYREAAYADPVRAARYRDVEAAHDAQRERDARAFETGEGSDAARTRLASQAVQLCADPVMRSVLNNRALAGLGLLEGPDPWSHCHWRLERLIDWEARLARNLPIARIGLPRRLDGTQLEVLGEQGLGDTLFFLRWIPALISRGAKVALRADRRLEPLLRRTGLFVEFRDPDDGRSRGVNSLLAGDLPALLEEAPRYPDSLSLTAIAGEPEAIRNRPRGVRRIAVTWRGGVEGAILFKQVPLDALARAVDDGRSLVVSLQRLPRPGENERMRDLLGDRFIDMSAMNADLEGTLGLLAACEEYVGVSNTNFHLRAGLGMVGRVLVPFPPEWRWFGEGESQGWYPRLTALRERQGLGWDEALRRLASILAAA